MSNSVDEIHSTSQIVIHDGELEEFKAPRGLLVANRQRFVRLRRRAGVG